MQLRQQLAVPDQVLRVVILSGHADVTAAVQAMKLGAIDLLTKPVEDPLLCATVKEACRLSLEELSCMWDARSGSRIW
jgi:two-component system, LuxR family, response regulator FixJ